MTVINLTLNDTKCIPVISYAEISSDLNSKSIDVSHGQMCVSSYKDMLVYYPSVNIKESKILPVYGSDLRSGYFG
jgi:hypothetical protein